MPSDHFSLESIAFLKDLRANNNKLWFERNRRVYETYLLDPLRELTTRLGATLFAVNPQLETRPQIGKAISRIYRDTRFSRSKLALRDTVWLSFRDRSLPNEDTPSFFFYIEVEEWGYGMGFWQASTAAMEEIRARLTSRPKQALKLLRDHDLQKEFVLGGEKFRRPRQADLPPEVLDFYNYRSFYFISRREIGKSLFSKKLWEEVAAGFRTLGPIYRYVVGI